jgi:glycerate kinase
LHRYGQILEQTSGRKVIKQPGAGAAGGMGAGLLGILQAELKPGIDTVLDLLHFEEQIRGADLLITGEGKLDQSSLSGKAAVGIARRAKKLELPVFAVVGSSELDTACVQEKGIDLLLPLMNGSMSLETAIAEVGSLLFEQGRKIIEILESYDF